MMASGKARVFRPQPFCPGRPRLLLRLCTRGDVPAPPSSRTVDTTALSPNETNPVLRPRVCTVGSAHRGGLKRCRRSSTGRVRSWDPLAAESLNRVTFENTPSQAASGLLRQRVRCCCPSGQQSTEEPTHASAVFHLETLEREQNGEPQWGRAALGADGLVLNALCRGTPAGFRLGRKSRRGVCPPMEEPTLGERVTVPRASRWEAPLLPRLIQVPADESRPTRGSETMRAVPATPTCPVCPGNPEDSTSRIFNFTRTPTISCSHSSWLQCPRSWGWNPRKCQSWGPIFGDGVRSQLLTKLNSDSVFLVRAGYGDAGGKTPLPLSAGAYFRKLPSSGCTLEGHQCRAPTEQQTRFSALSGSLDCP